MPLLRKLAVHYRRPQIEYPDLVVLNSGYWDLRRYTEGPSPATPACGNRPSDVHNTPCAQQRTLSPRGTSLAPTRKTRPSRTRP